MFDEGDDDLDKILGGAEFDIDEDMESPPHLDDECDRINMGVGKAPTTDAAGTDGLATKKGRCWELRGEGPCQAPSLTCSNTVSQACKNYSPRGS